MGAAFGSAGLPAPFGGMPLMPGGGALMAGVRTVADAAGASKKETTLAFATGTDEVEPPVRGGSKPGGLRYSSEALAPLPVEDTGVEVAIGGRAACSLAALDCSATFACICGSGMALKPHGVAAAAAS